ncbi:uncharacterized protein LOC107415557 [Ziziphus jujuba]|uniref:Uncharacterized protein LOC107415557 n=1 Tax=Ziziphus jujuba TaxID=326968 RepID=A0A6P3ZL66_ZIZJJ|nr:uncharacterized protein LOC107415557 [Ziziphus jujuba]
MKFLSWNCRGLGHPRVINVFKSLVRKSNLSCVFLCETKGGRDRLEKVCRSLGYHNMEIIEAKGNAGGLCLMWSDDVNLKIERSNERVICGDMLDDVGNPTWSFLACHSPPYIGEKKNFWSQLIGIVNDLNRPWILFGDLNEIIDESEKFGGCHIWRIKLLKDFIHEMDGLDLGFIGGHFT